MAKSVSISARVDEKLFEEFKQAYLEQLESSFKEGTPPELIKKLSEPSNSDLVSLAFTFGLKGLKGQEKA